MVTLVWGVANGVQISFSYLEGDVWTADVPWTDDGEYAMELWGEDDAGNRSYLCRTVWVISGHEIAAYVIPEGYAGSLDRADYSALPELGEYLAAMAESRYDGVTVEKKYEAEAAERGYQVERVVCCRAAT